MPPKAKIQKNNAKCTICEVAIYDACRALQCDLCDRWSHQVCEKVKDKTYDAITDVDEHEHVAWYCKWCHGAALPLHHKLAALELRVDTLEEQSVTKTEIPGMIEKQLETKAKDLKSQIEASTKATIITTSEIEVRECMKEIKEISRRENNIVIHKLDETDDTPPKEQAIQVLKVCLPNIDDDDITEAIRVGDKKPDQHRPLLVKMDATTKSQVMKNLKKLKSSRYNVSISHDLPPRTRQNRKRLMDQAREAAGEAKENFLYKFVGPFGLETVKTTKKKEKPPGEIANPQK